MANLDLVVGLSQTAAEHVGEAEVVLDDEHVHRPSMTDEGPS